MNYNYYSKRMGNAQKNLSKKKKSSDSLSNISGQTISGGMGEHVDGTDDSRHCFADDDATSTEHALLPDCNQNKCLRCSSDLTTRARYCRQCYEQRRLWMPRRPTRRVTPSGTRRNISHHSIDDEGLFLPKPDAFMRGDIALPNPLYSNLPRYTSPGNDSSSDSDYDFEKERNMARAKRREYFKSLQETSSNCDTSDNSTESSDGNRICRRCRIRQQNAFIIHGDTAHSSFCYICASELIKTNSACPECGRAIDHIVKKNIF